MNNNTHNNSDMDLLKGAKFSIPFLDIGFILIIFLTLSIVFGNESGLFEKSIGKIKMDLPTSKLLDLKEGLISISLLIQLVINQENINAIVIGKRTENIDIIDELQEIDNKHNNNQRLQNILEFINKNKPYKIKHINMNEIEILINDLIKQNSGHMVIIRSEPNVAFDYIFKLYHKVSINPKIKVLIIIGDVSSLPNII